MSELFGNKKISIRYQGRSVTVDLCKIIAINHPNANDKYFLVYFTGNMVWRVGSIEHDRLYKAWMDV